VHRHDEPVYPAASEVVERGHWGGLIAETSNEKRATNNEQRKTSNEKRATKNEQRKTSNEQRATNNEQRTTSNEQ
jgi:hypothetical protein